MLPLFDMKEERQSWEMIQRKGLIDHCVNCKLFQVCLQINWNGLSGLCSDILDPAKKNANAKILQKECESVFFNRKHLKSDVWDSKCQVPKKEEKAIRELHSDWVYATVAELLMLNFNAV